MKKAFTLIELLAVIIILAVVALIATPIVLNVVEDAKKSAAKSQTGLILDSAKLYYAERYFKTGDSFEGYECSIANKIGCNELSLEGDKPDQAVLTISKQGKVNGKVVVGKYTYYICDNKISETEDCKVLDYQDIYEVTEDGTITSIKDSEYVNNGEVTIPEFIGENEVSKIAASTFVNTEITKVTILANKPVIIEENALPETVTTLVVKSCYEDSYSEYADILEVIETECEIDADEITEYVTLFEDNILTNASFEKLNSDCRYSISNGIVTLIAPSGWKSAGGYFVNLSVDSTEYKKLIIEAAWTEGYDYRILLYEEGDTDVSDTTFVVDSENTEGVLYQMGRQSFERTTFEIDLTDMKKIEKIYFGNSSLSAKWEIYNISFAR